MKTTAAAQAGTPALSPASSQWTIGLAIAARAVSDRMTVVGVLAFYGLALGAGVGALWPPLQETFADLSDSLPAAVDQLMGGVSLATPAGWMNAEMMTFIAPGFLIAIAIISAGRAVAGEEDGRTMGLVLSTPAGRNTFLAAKTAAMVAHVCIVSVVMFFGLLLGNVIGDMGISIGLMIAANVQMTLLGLVFGAITLTVGVAGADRRQTTAISAGLAGLSLVLAVFLPLSDSLKSLAKFNFWYPYSANVALVDGFDWGLAAVMVACAVLISAVGFVIFPRRDLRG